VLSTVHSAKGQEWDSVYVLNVSDGNFPSEFSTGRSEQVEEERRLLYVAMTRAKDDLHLIAPLKYYVANQSRTGDRHVYGAKSRFLTRGVMAMLSPTTWPAAEEAPSRPSPAKTRVNVAEKLRGLW
jgi:DNA helicase-2/ATP-dependent DNA helicase PcrA